MEPAGIRNDVIRPGIHYIEVVFLDIEKYSLTSNKEQTTIINDFSNLINLLLADFCNQQNININHVLKLPTGDGAAIIFLNLEKPGTSFKFAKRFLLNHNNYRTRVGVHAGDGIVYQDINGQLNVAGETINITQRIMSIGDGQQIILSEAIHKTIINYDIAERSRFRCYRGVEVKHGVLINVYQYIPSANEEKLISSSEPDKIIEPVKIFTDKLHNCLSNINNTFDVSSLANCWYISGDVINETKAEIASASNIIRIVCYSFTTWSNLYGSDLKIFLEKNSNAVLEILLLEPRSIGFLEKTSYESFLNLYDIDKWKWETSRTRFTHLSEQISSMERINKLQRDVKEVNPNISCSMYSHTPIINGIITDDKTMLVSSYFINPLKRGSELPCLKIIKNNSNNDLLILFDLVLNWYKVNFAIGSESKYLKKQSAI